jgi:hypothetical protein
MTGHFTSYETRTNHELATANPAILNSGFAGIFEVLSPCLGGFWAGRGKRVVKVVVAPLRRWTVAGGASRGRRRKR